MKMQSPLSEGSGRYRSPFRIVALASQIKRTFNVRISFLLNRKSLIAVMILIAVASAIVVWRIKAHTQSVLDAERARLEKQNLIPFEKKTRPTIDSKQIEIWQSYRDSRAVARFKDSYFVATDGGLVELDTKARFLRHYSVLDGLPESDLVSLASFNAKLFIGTRAQGLLSFDGERFESYRWLDRLPQAVNNLFADAGRLLIGTMAGGLIEFDGAQFKEIRVGADHKRLPAIISLSRNGSRLFVGTFADGLWIEEGARWTQFTVADGLPSNRIVGVAADARTLFVASDYGLASATFSSLSSEPTQRSAHLFQSAAVLPSLASIVQLDANILLCKDNGEGFVLRIDPDGLRAPQLQPLGGKSAGALAGSRLLVLDHQLWTLNSNGFRRSDDDLAGGSVNNWDGQFDHGSNGAQAPISALANSLTNNLIAALAVDARSRLWAGGFRTGIDVLTPEGQRLAHLESDNTREINSLIEDRKANTMLAATSQGLLTFDATLRAVGRLSTTEGLLSNAVMQVTANQPGVTTGAEGESHYYAYATGKGLTMGAPGKLRSLTTVQGLPSNSVYTVLTQGRNLYVGTLSGLALIQDGRVIRVFKDSNSNLSTNWVTALCPVGSRLFVGTYGGGVFELTSAGELIAFTAGTAHAVVNPNAMWSDGKRLYVGTLDGALMFELQSQAWTVIKAELPARAVLSITGDERYVYFGTTSGIARIERSYWEQPI